MPGPFRTRRVTIITVFVVALMTIPTVLWAAHQFDDVPDSNIFHNDIDWLAQADVTRGCNPPANTQFCPGDEVTREQMAAFLRRLAENQVVDAATVQGSAPGDLRSFLVHDSVSSDVLFPGNFDVIQIKTVAIQAPESTGGAILVQAGGDITGNGAAVDDYRVFACWISTDALSTDSQLGAHITFPLAAPIGASSVIQVPFSTTTALELEAGAAVDIYLLCRDTAGNDGNQFRVTNGHLSATFMPGDGHVVTSEVP